MILHTLEAWLVDRNHVTCADNPVPPRDPKKNDDDDENDEEEDKERRPENDEPAVIREPDEDE
jgi:hypothetical protein